MKLTLFEKLLIPITAVIVLCTALFYAFRGMSAEGLAVVPASIQEADTGTPFGGEDEEDGRINLNTAGLTELMGLPGIGDVIARRIIEYRETFGPFRTTAELMNIEGIGQARYSAIMDLVKI